MIKENFDEMTSQEEYQEYEDIGSYMGMSDEEFDKIEFNSEPREEVQEQTQEEQVEETQLDLTEERQITPEEFYEKVTSTFRANGRDFRITDPDDAIKLMQAGLAYNKQKTTLENNLGLSKTLEMNKVTSPEDIQFLLDLRNHDKAAIAKLLKDANVDTYDLPDLDETPYQPKASVMTSKQVEVQGVIEDLKTLDGGNHMLSELNRWDDQSLEFFTSTPDAMYLLYDDKKSGMFDNVLRTIEHDRAIGKIPQNWLDKPFIELYEFVANSLSRQQQNSTQKIIGNNVRPNTVVQQERSNVPKSAGIPSNRNFSSSAQEEAPDFLRMSDEQFEEYMRLHGSNFY